jgi:hypothetical protein
VCTLEIYQWWGDPYFASAAISKGAFAAISKQGKHMSLVI